MIRLTRWIIALTVALGVIAGLQLWAMLKRRSVVLEVFQIAGAKKTVRAILDHAERVSDLIRKRLNSLTIVPDGQMREERER